MPKSKKLRPIGQRLKENDQALERSKRRYGTSRRSLLAALGEVFDDDEMRGLEAAELKGLSIWLSEEIKNPERLTEWKELGEAAIKAERPDLAPDAEFLVFYLLTGDPDVKKGLKELGMKEEKARSCFKGTVSLSKLVNFAKAHNGTVARVVPGRPDEIVDHLDDEGLDEAIEEIKAQVHDPDDDARPDDSRLNEETPGASSKEETGIRTQPGEAGAARQGMKHPVRPPAKPGNGNDKLRKVG